MSDNVMVCCRFRPKNNSELDRRDEDVIDCPDSRTVAINAAVMEEKRGPSAKTTFSFDYVFPPGSSQEDVFEHTARDFTDEVMKGFNCTIFAYGQTGSGKTFTMMGVPGNEGIIPRLASSIFDHIDQADEQIEFTVKISYVEIYMEHIKDLLNPINTNLKIREGTRGGVWIQDVMERYVSSIEEILEIMAIGAEQRAVASTNMNDESSRSHSVFMMTVGQRSRVNGSKTGSKLILVDLAGSETVAKTGASGNTLKEAQHINKSLSALGNVINALTSNSSHVPYRDSKLTRLLSDSLGGNSKTCLIVTASPAFYNLDETLSTLRFGTRAKKIKNKPTANQEKSVAEYKALLEAAIAKCTEQEEYIQKLQRQIVRLKAIIKELGGRIPDDLEEMSAKPKKSARQEEYDDEEEAPSRAQHQEAVLFTLELKEQIREKEDMVKHLQEDVDEKDAALDALQKELDAKTIELNRLRSAKGGAISDAEAEGKFKAQTDALDAAKKRIEALEKEQVVYIQQIDRLHADNLELAHLQQLNLAASSQVAANAANASATNAAGANGASADGKAPKTPKDDANRKKRGSNVSGAESDSDSDDAMDKPKGVMYGSAEETIRTLKTNYEVLMAALGRKCEQYIQLQMQVSKQTEKINDFEKKLQAKSEKSNVPETGADPAAVTKMNAQIAEMQKRLEASENLCKKLFESGLYWQKRGQRKDKELKDIRRQLSERQINIGLSSAQSEAGDVPPSISELRVHTYFEGQNNDRPERETSVQFGSVSYHPHTTRAVSEMASSPPISPRSTREPYTPTKPSSGYLGSTRVNRAPSIAAKLAVPHLIHGGGKGSAKSGQSPSARPPVTQQTFDAMDQFF